MSLKLVVHVLARPRVVHTVYIVLLFNDIIVDVLKRICTNSLSTSLMFLWLTSHSLFTFFLKSVCLFGMKVFFFSQKKWKT